MSLYYSIYRFSEIVQCFSFVLGKCIAIDKLTECNPISYWDLSFPAVLKVYLEWSSALGITFRYDEDGQQVGLSQARALVYLTSAGGPVEGQNYGFDYLKALGAMFGIPHAYCVAAEGLDIQGTDVQAVLRRAGDRAASLARQLAQEPMCLHG